MIRKSVEIDIQSNADKAAKGVTSIKAELRAAKEELIKSQQEFGEYSEEAIKAAKSVARLKDQIQEANETAALFDPGARFSALTGALTAVAGGFSTVTGAMGLLGVESQEVEEMILKVNSAMALTTGLSALADSAKDFNRLGAIASQAFNAIGTSAKAAFSGIRGAILATGIGAFVVALGLIAANWDDIKKSVSGAATETDRYKEIQGEVSSKLKDTFQNLQDVKNALQSAKDGVISKETALKTYNEKLGDALGKTDDFATAEKRLSDNTGIYIKAMQARITAQILYGKAAEIAAKMATGEDVKDFGFWDTIKVEAAGMLGLNAKAQAIASSVADKRNDSQKEYNELLKAANKFQSEASSLDKKIGADGKNAQYEKDKKDRAKAEADRKAVEAKALADRIANDKAYAEFKKKLEKETQDFLDDTEQKKLDRARQRELDDINALKGKTDAELQILRDASKAKFDILQEQLKNEENLKAQARQKEAEENANATHKDIQSLIDSNVVKRSLADAQNAEELQSIYTQLQAELDARQAAQIKEFEDKQAQDLLEYEQEFGKGEAYYTLKEQQENDIISLKLAQGQEDVNLKQEFADAKKNIDDKEQEDQKKKVATIGQTLENASALLGEHTLAGKALAIAATTISTYQSAVDGYKGMVSAIPGPIGIAAGAVAAAASIASGLATVKKIVSVKVPAKGGSGSGGAGGAVSAPPKPSVNFQNTPQTQITDSIERSAETRNNQPITAVITSGAVASAASAERNRVDDNRF